eukprot:TRINITY_DN120450_c1_g1_i1.p1 TRINITY_DN120450_c1_g1~~TRINITY_DN120450_c1_g1_i1.p1  ORF type:complete len:660 (+),score=35.16 TRINITY_DN120450_c1_g1_i1:3854-5833(+)
MESCNKSYGRNSFEGGSHRQKSFLLEIIRKNLYLNKEPYIENQRNIHRRPLLNQSSALPVLPRSYRYVAKGQNFSKIYLAPRISKSLSKRPSIENWEYTRKSYRRDNDFNLFENTKRDMFRQLTESRKSLETSFKPSCKFPKIKQKHPNSLFLTKLKEGGLENLKARDNCLCEGVIGLKVSERAENSKLHAKFARRNAEAEVEIGKLESCLYIPKRSSQIHNRSTRMKKCSTTTFDTKSEVKPDKVLKPISTPPIIIHTLNKFGKKSGTIVPTNLESEEKAFFQSNCTINPRFTYESPKLVKKLISLYQKPNGSLLSLATKIMDAFLAQYTTESQYLEKNGGILTLEETQEIFKQYIDELNLTEYIQLRFASNTISPTAITHDSKNGISTITIGLPIEYRSGKIKGVLNHEIGTHFLRKYNDRLQPWSSSRKQYQLKNYMATEEGLASLNQLYEVAINSEVVPYLFKPAVYYYACSLASEMSFVELYNALGKYIDSPKRRFKACLRVKRGLENTEESGGFYKDKVYLEGAIKILMKRKDINWKLLYSGKVSVDDLDKLKGVVSLGNIICPYFVRDEATYMKALNRIARENFIEQQYNPYKLSQTNTRYVLFQVNGRSGENDDSPCSQVHKAYALTQLPPILGVFFLYHRQVHTPTQDSR